MEKTSVNTTSLVIDLESKSYFLETAKWAKFFGILGFIFSAILLLVALILVAAAGLIVDQIQSTEGTSMPKWIYSFMGVLYLIMSVIGIYISLLLYRFGDRTIVSLNTEQQPLFTNAIKNLRTVFRIYGIFFIIYLVLIILAFIGGIIGGVLAG